MIEELPAFMAGYAYSLVSNTFVQRAGAKLGTKHLMTLGVNQVVHSLRKQGTALADTIVTAVSQLLSKELALLSQVCSFLDAGFPFDKQLVPHLCALQCAYYTQR